MCLLGVCESLSIQKSFIKEFHTGNIIFIDAARKAIEAGLPHLARLLIKRESDEEKQVN